MLYVLSFLSILCAKIQLIMHSTAQAATKIETKRETTDLQVKSEKGKVKNPMACK